MELILLHLNERNLSKDYIRNDLRPLCYTPKPMDMAKLFAIGLAAGVLSGMFGIGGGLVIVPALVFLMKMDQLDSIATSLAALIPPVGLLGAFAYYRSGHINIRYALLIAAGLFLGAYFGARVSLGLSPLVLRRIYGIFLLFVSARLLLLGK
jgi:uncharacterized protein